MNAAAADIEAERLRQRGQPGHDWDRWGPYLSQREWGTVREDYSAQGTAWDSFPHDHARLRAYRWGEDGLLGVSDRRQWLCMAPALWNGRDPILKERLFGVTNSEGNHGEDVKEWYWFEDATPTHSYLKARYAYPLAPYPYHDLAERSRQRSAQEREYEIADTGVFAQGLWDVAVEYAKADDGDLCMRITVTNHSPHTAELHVLPQVWYRNLWSWRPGRPRPVLVWHGADANGPAHLAGSHYRHGNVRVAVEADAVPLLCENDSNPVALKWLPDVRGYWKDGINQRVVAGELDAVNPALIGSKAALWQRVVVPAGASRCVRLRLREGTTIPRLDEVDDIIAHRAAEADQWWSGIQSDVADAESRQIQRQALAGMVWSKQYYGLDVRRWLAGDPSQPTPPRSRLQGRNSDWEHVVNDEIVLMPDTWEYPWYAAWDLAFHAYAYAAIDARFAKDQLLLLTREWYMHPNGQLPAYEWAFGDVNPPVHAWAAWRVFQIDRKQHGGDGDVDFLERIFHKLLLNFTWWVNRKDAGGRNVFQGGFLGLDNIGVFDRSQPLPAGGHINQVDGTAWMAMYALNLMRIALELAVHRPAYEDVASKFFEHFLHIAEAMTDLGGRGVGMWDEGDSFFYDVLSRADGSLIPLKTRSLVGLIPLFAVETIDPEQLARLPGFTKRMEWFLNHRPDLAGLVSQWNVPGGGQQRLLSLLRGHRMKCLLNRALDESEFLSDFGIRSLSRIHKDHPYVFPDAPDHQVAYQSGESTSGLFGGNSNWRGPVWFPVNVLLIESLQKFHYYYGDDFTVECPVGSGTYLTLDQVANALAKRLCRLFRSDAAGVRPCHGAASHPAFRDLMWFHEYFDGDSGRGCGASHQTGWTALVARLVTARYHPHDLPTARHRKT